MAPPLRIGVVGHVEHITLARVAGMPVHGEILHLAAPIVLAGGGAGISFAQLARSDAEVHFFTALGDDDAARFVERSLVATGATIHAARRAAPQTRDTVLVDPSGERTILVIGEPLHPRASDALPWELLATLDAVYFTAQDPDLLVLARAARRLVVTARRRECIAASHMQLDVIVGSAQDPRERSTRADYALAPYALVMTEGRHGGYVDTADGRTTFTSPKVAAPQGTYGAGDSFAGALTYYLATGLPVPQAAARAAPHGAAVVRTLDPLAGQLPLPFSA